MSISIVIPVYNDPRIEYTLASIRSQVYSGDVEIIVIDAGSTDETLDVVHANDDIVSVLVSEPDGGIFDALNKGIRRASGDIIALVGSDDRFNGPGVFSLVQQALEDSSVDGCYGDLVYVNDDDRVVRYWRSGSYRSYKLYLGWIVPHFTLFLRKSAYDKVGLLDTRYRIAADYDFFLRLFLKHKLCLAYVPKVLLRMTLGGISNRSWRTIREGNLDAMRAWRNNRLRGGLVAPLLKPLQKLPQFILRPGNTSQT